MKSSLVVLALGALVCTLAAPLAAAIWGEAHPMCGCSPEACFCPHGSQPVRHAPGSEGSAAPESVPHAAHPENRSAQTRPASSGDASHCHKPGRTPSHEPDHKPGHELGAPAPGGSDAGERCVIRRCGRGSMPGAGSAPTLPKGDFLAASALPLPHPAEPTTLEVPRLPPDVFPGVEPPPPRR